MIEIFFKILTFLSRQHAAECWRNSGGRDRVNIGEHDGVIVTGAHHGVGQHHVLEHEPVLADVGVALLNGVLTQAGGSSVGVVGGLDVGVVLADGGATGVGGN